MDDLFLWLWFLAQFLGVLCIAGFIGDKIGNATLRHEKRNKGDHR